MPSFDIVSKVDMQEVDNAINQAIKEIAQRYDFKGSKCEVTLEKESIKVLADDDFRLKAVIEARRKSGKVEKEIPLEQVVDFRLAREVRRELGF